MSGEIKYSYHDLEIETAEIPKTSIFNLPYCLRVTCTRTGGWELWDWSVKEGYRLVAGEYDTNWLRLTVGDTVIVDSSTEAPDQDYGHCSYLGWV